MIKYLVCGTAEVGLAEARAQGWQEIASRRFATPEKDDIRVIHRYTDFIPWGAPTVMIRGKDFSANPDAPKFEAFVSDGSGKWEEIGG